MSLDLKVIQVSELDEILEFERKRMAEVYPDVMERDIQSWNARWRLESLQHYVNTGWSFLARDPQGQLVGYFLAQPLLFLDGQTQSLWVEYLQSSSLQARDGLTELAYRLAREKHLQRVYFPNQPHLLNAIRGFKPEEWNSQAVYLKTTKV